MQLVQSTEIKIKQTILLLTNKKYIEKNMEWIDFKTKINYSNWITRKKLIYSVDYFVYFCVFIEKPKNKYSKKLFTNKIQNNFRLNKPIRPTIQMLSSSINFIFEYMVKSSQVTPGTFHHSIIFQKKTFFVKFTTEKPEKGITT